MRQFLSPALLHHPHKKKKTRAEELQMFRDDGAQRNLVLTLRSASSLRLTCLQWERDPTPGVEALDCCPATSRRCRHCFFKVLLGLPQTNRFHHTKLISFTYVEASHLPEVKGPRAEAVRHRSFFKFTDCTKASVL